MFHVKHLGTEGCLFAKMLRAPRAMILVHQGLRPRVVFASLEWDEHPLAQ